MAAVISAGDGDGSVVSREEAGAGTSTPSIAYLISISGCDSHLPAFLPPLLSRLSVVQVPPHPPFQLSTTPSLKQI
jgi:hypothetical protein